MQRRAGSLRIGCKRLGKRDTASCKHVQANAGWRDAVETYRAQIGSKLLPIYQVRKTTGRSRTVVRQYLRLSQRTAYRPSSVLEWLSANWPAWVRSSGAVWTGRPRRSGNPKAPDHGQHRLSASIDKSQQDQLTFSGRSRSDLGEGTSEQRVRGRKVRTLAFWESRSGVRDGVLDVRA
jgi:hypothetical protein